MKVSELMTKDVMIISPEISIKDAAKLLFAQQISGLPVVDSNHKVVGMLTEKEIIGLALPKFAEDLGDFDVTLDDELFFTKIAAIDKLKVKDVMRKEVLCVNEGLSVAEAARLMIAKKARRMPVLDKEKKLVGIIARADIVKVIARETGLV